MSEKLKISDNNPNPVAEQWAGYKEQYSNAVEDIDKAHAMAIAGDRNETNLVAFKNIAKAHMDSPDTPKSPMGAEITSKDGVYHYSSGNPEIRVVKSVEGTGGRYAYTADDAIKEAQKEREEADKQEQLAAERYDALKSL